MKKQNEDGQKMTAPDDLELLYDLFNYGVKIVMELSGSSVTPFPDRDALRDFVERIKQAKDEKDRFHPTYRTFSLPGDNSKPGPLRLCRNSKIGCLFSVMPDLIRHPEVQPIEMTG